MRWLEQLRMRFEMLFRRGRAGEHLDDELRFHLGRQIAENIEAGMNAEEARYAALRAFGNPALLRDQARATWSWSAVESILFDLRYSVRTLARSPGFTAIAILIMALGIGANVALFTVVRSMLLKPLPYRDPARLFMLYQRDVVTRPQYNAYLPVDAGSFWDWQNAAQGMADMAMVSPWQSYNVSAENGKLPEQVDAGLCSWNFFQLLGVEPVIGRLFLADDDRPDATATVLIGDSFWKRRIPPIQRSSARPCFSTANDTRSSVCCLNTSPLRAASGATPSSFGHPCGTMLPLRCYKRMKIMSS